MSLGNISTLQSSDFKRKCTYQLFIYISIQLKSGNKVGGLLFADDFVGITESSENLQQLIDIIYEFCSKWRLRANVNKSAVLVFGIYKVKGK